ncbi:MAG: response regulator transcription factor [Chthoniobacterales bacterium]|nr:response regulator transcription factor [Chthoniobacterales bacterium]
MSETLKVLIVDDEVRARGLIRKMLSGDKETEIAGECADGYEAVAAIKKSCPDLAFLDVQMPEKDGFAVLRELQGWDLPAIIFVTAFEQYAIKAFEVHALDYLLKPFDRERFLKVFQRAKREIHAQRRGEKNGRLSVFLAAKNARFTDRIAVKHRGRILLLKVQEIDWIEAEENYVRLHTGAGSYLTRETLSGLEGKLDPKHFLRIHRSAMVNLERLTEIEPTFHGEYVLHLSNKQSVRLGRSYRENFFTKVGYPR